MLRPYTPDSPEKLEAELDLAVARGRGGDVAGGAGDAGRILGGRRRENDQVGRVGVGAVEEVEELGAELQGEALAELGVFEDAEIPGGEAGADVGVATEIAGEAALGRWCDKGRGIEILARIAGDDFAGEVGVEERAHRVAGVAGVGGVVAELRSDREAGLGGDDAGKRPASDEAAGP